VIHATPGSRIKRFGVEASMICIWHPSLSVVLGFLIALTFGSHVQAQSCGGGFAKFIVVDSENTSVPNVTIELLAELPREEYAKYKLRKGSVQHGGSSFKLSPSEAQELGARAVPNAKVTDFCGNPVKQRVNSTRVKTHKDALEQGDGSVKNFGFCTLETYRRVYLLKISAPGYVTDHYIGTYLGGCGASYSFVLTKLSDTKLSQSQEPPVVRNKKRIGPVHLSHAHRCFPGIRSKS